MPEGHSVAAAFYLKNKTGKARVINTGGFLEIIIKHNEIELKGEALILGNAVYV